MNHVFKTLNDGQQPQKSTQAAAITSSKNQHVALLKAKKERQLDEDLDL